MEDDSRLKEALERISQPGSYYWAFWDPEGLDPNLTYEVEIRVNLPDGAETSVPAPEGWQIAHRKTGMIFLRRRQRIDEPAIRRLFSDALTLALANGGTFHSWRHAPELPDWSAA